MESGEASTNFCEESNDLDFNSPLRERENRRVYLITYARANLDRFPNCLAFSDIVLEAFNNGKSSKKVVEWACCIEDHADGAKHFHMAVKLNGTRRWNPVKNFIYKKYGISLHFSSKHYGYVAAYRYVCKEKDQTEVLHSPNHTNMESIGSPRTKKAMHVSSSSSARRKHSTEDNGQQREFVKRKRLSNSDVAEFMVSNNIRKESELMAVALQRSQNGEKDLHAFILNKTPKALAELIQTTWKVQEAPATVEREASCRISLIREAAAKECDCNGEWMRCSREILAKNHINAFVFASALRQCFIKGRKKNTNVLLVGPTNCGKSFLLNPVELIFQTFVKPATSRYAWVGLDECEVAYLNDFRWTPEIIAWSDFLLLLEGQTVHLPRPKNQFATDMLIDRTNTIPFFCTSKEPIEFVGKYNTRDERETDMMSSRWLSFQFSYQIPGEQMKDLEPCTTCFSKLVLLGSEADSNENV